MRRERKGMRTRLVRVRRKPRGVFWAMVMLAVSMAVYIRVSVPMLREFGREETKTEPGERVTEEVSVEPLGIYLVSFGGYDVMNSAKVEAARYVPRGAAGYILKKEKLYVIGAGYAEKAEAEKACVYLAAQEGLACAVIEMYCPGVNMRMTAGSAQIEAFLDAEKTLRGCAQTMGQMAFAVDRGEASLSQAQEVVKTQRKKLEAAQKALLEAAGGTDSGVFRGIGTLLEEMLVQTGQMLEDEKTMGLSGRLKYCHIDMTVREIEMLNALMR